VPGVDPKNLHGRGLFLHEEEDGHNHQNSMVVLF